MQSLKTVFPDLKLTDVPLSRPPLPYVILGGAFVKITTQPDHSKTS